MDAIARMLIEHACAKRYSIYAFASDSMQVEDFVRCFTPDATWVRPDRGLIMRNRDEIRTYMNGRRDIHLSEKHQLTHHFTTVKVDVTSETEAEALAYAIAYRETNFSGETPSRNLKFPQLIVRYSTIFKLHEGEWLIHDHRPKQLWHE